jgi:hypothetical protein
MANRTNYEVILSIYGKHSLIAQWTDERSSELTLELARIAYKQLVLWLALDKQKKVKSNAPYCQDHQIPMAFRKGKYGNFYSCTYKSEDGSYCKNTAKAS